MTTVRSSTFRLAALVWAGGMLGFVAMIWLHFPTILPELLHGRDPGMATSSLLWIATAQSAFIVALAAWAGAKTAASVGLRAPMLEAVAAGHTDSPAQVPQLFHALGFGVLGGLFLLAANALAPEAWIGAQTGYYPSLLPRLLFGGITEEVLMRWGLMSTVVWLLCRSNRALGQPPRAAQMWIGIITVALLFGVAHLPAVANATGGLDAYLTFYIVAANAVAGTLFGWVYWRHGLEAAVIAHAFAHLVNYLYGPI